MKLLLYEQMMVLGLCALSFWTAVHPEKQSFWPGFRGNIEQNLVLQAFGHSAGEH
jgi:hypothetical protein